MESLSYHTTGVKVLKKTNEERLQDLMSYMDRLTHIEPEDIPDINLYMDQVTTFMNERIAGTRHNPDEVVITKTMINNYAKNRLLPAPVKKKYSRNHILMLILIYYYKYVVTYSEIEELFSPISEKHFAAGAEPGLPELYRELFSLEEEQRKILKQDVLQKFRAAEEIFPDAPEEDREFLRLFAFVSELAFDVYIKKEMIELLSDELRKERHPDTRKH